MEGRYGWQKANIKTQGPRSTTWKKAAAAKSVQRTGAPAGLESRKMDTKSGRRKANIKTRVTTTWKKPKPKEGNKEIDATPGLGDIREVPKKTDTRSGRRKANIKSRVTTTRKKPKSKAREKEITATLANVTEAPRKMEAKEEWQKANIKMHLLRAATWKKKSGGSVQETESLSGLESDDEIPESEVRKGWRRASLKIRATRPKTWKKTKSPDIAHETESASDLEPGDEFPEKKDPKKRWRRADVNIRAIKAAKAGAMPSLLQGVDDKKSKFVLINLEHYTVHPNLIQYYEPLKVTEQQKLLASRQKIKRFMFRVTDFDQNKTLLIMTNNPPPGPVNWQEKDSPPSYFSQTMLAKEQQKAINRTGLPLMKKKKKLKNESRTPFPVVILEDAKPKKEQWYRDNSTKADFKGEAKYSKLHALRKQQETYPNLSFVPDCRSVAAARAEAARRKVSIVTWEPLTLATLLEEKPTLTVPLPGESPFRYGRAPQWFTNAPTVSN
ncbi:testis-specific gene 13 protein [Sminthopsis crassicaudata]|uniref:testis-specific gene 13 protein n=1 Tax=Sminthopsis crassicaudata TaxID=9301 RepID=UPI003D68CF7F